MVDIAQQLVQSQRQNQPPSVAGVQARADRAEEVRVYVKGVKDAIVVSAQDLATAAGTHINFMRENPEAVSLYLPLILNNKFKEAKGFIDMATDGLTPLQRGAAATMALPLAGDITGLAADIEMYITDPESRNWVNYTLSGAGVAGGAATMSPAMVAIMPKIKRNIDAWHGSPHRLDKFSMSKIGTGEGAQAYGHGLYFAENKEVAEGYRQAGQFFTGADGSLPTFAAYKGKPFHKADVDDIGKKAINYFDELKFYAEGDPRRAARMIRDTFQESMSKNKAGDDAMLKELFDTDDLGLLDDYKNAPEPEELRIAKWIEDNADDLSIEDATHLYNVDLKVSPDDLLDWDAPLSEQSESVQQAVEKIRKQGGVAGESFDMLISDYGSVDNISGKNLVEMLGGNRPEGAAAMREAGIPGIRYYDGGSRMSAGGVVGETIQDADGWRSRVHVKNRGGSIGGAPTDGATISMPFPTEAEATAWAEKKAAEGTRNFVIFDDSLVDIKTRNGEALTPVQRQEAVTSMTSGTQVDPGLGYNQAERDAMGAGINTRDHFEHLDRVKTGLLEKSQPGYIDPDAHLYELGLDEYVEDVDLPAGLPSLSGERVSGTNQPVTRVLSDTTEARDKLAARGITGTDAENIINDVTETIMNGQEIRAVWEMDEEGMALFEMVEDAIRTKPEALPGGGVKYQWMRNAEGGQTGGNKQSVVPFTEDLFNEVRDKGQLRSKTYEEYRRKFPDVTHISVTDMADGTRKTGTIGSLDELRPPQEHFDNGWVIETNDFDSPEALLQLQTADSDLIK